MPSKASSNKVIMKLLHKMDRYDKNEKIFIGYLFILLIFVLFTPIVKVTWLKWTEWYGIWLYKSSKSSTSISCPIYSWLTLDEETIEHW